MIEKYIEDNILNPKYNSRPRIICHVVNNKGGFGAGFALEVAKKYPLVCDKYKEWYGMSLLLGDNKFRLGDIQIVKVNETLTFINMLAQNGYKSQINTIPIDYNALEKCLLKVKEYNERKQLPILMPKIGAGLGGGDWNKIETIINNILDKQKVYIFDLKKTS